MTALYSQYNNPKIDYHILRIFEIIILCSTYFSAMIGLISAGSSNTEDDKRMKAIKEMEKEEKATHNHK